MTRTSTYSDVLDTTLRFEARAKERQIEQEPRKKVKTGGQVFRQSETTGSVAQPMGRGTSSRGAQSGMRGQTTGVKDKPGSLC